MKNLSVLPIFVLLLFISVGSFAQEAKAPASPPAAASGKIGDATVSITYSAPSVKGRKIWGDLVPFDQVWRTGANQCTSFTTDKAISFGGKSLPAGTYGLFTIPGEKEWTIIFNKDSKQWGAYDYKAGEDVLRITATPAKSKAFQEKMNIFVAHDKVSIDWENLSVKF